MTRRLTAWLVPIAVLLAECAGSAMAVRVTDDTGHVVELAEPASKIVSLAPHATEMLFAVGADEQVVAVSAYSDYPAAARRLPQVGDARGIDVEAVLAHEPDLVVAWKSGTPQRQLARIRELGAPVYVTEPSSLDAIASNLERLGRLAGHRRQGARRADELRSELAELRRRYADRPPVRVFFQIWHQPVMTVGGSHPITEAIRLCGGRNVFADLEVLAPSVSVEAVLAADPQVVVTAMPSGVGQRGGLTRWRAWSDLAATRNGHLLSIEPDLIQRMGPRIARGVARLCRYLESAR